MLELIAATNKSVRYRDGFPILPRSYPLDIARMLLGVDIDMEEAFREAHRDLGPLVYLRMPSRDWMLLCEGPEAFEVLKHKASSIEHNQRISPALIGQSMLAHDDPLHHHMRSAMNGPFVPRGLSANHVGAMTAEIITARVRRWEEHKTIKILAETQELALDIIFRILGIEPTELAAWRKHYQEFLLSLVPIPIKLPGFPAYRAARARTWLDARFRGIVARARLGDGQGLIAALVQSKDEAGKELSERELLDNLLVLAVAGHETTASTIAWMVITLARRPDLWDALCEEANKAETVPDSPQALRDFPFAEAMFRESLRMYPPAFLSSRQTKEWITLHHHRIPPKTIIGIELGMLAKDPAVFPNPQRFEPARWMGRKGPPTPIEISQFGGGPHFCLGYHLAVLEGTQFAVGLAQAMSKKGLYPRLADGPGPRRLFSPLGHPSPGSRVDFIRSSAQV